MLILVETNQQKQKTMKAATLKTTGITVYIHANKKPSHGWNDGMVVVSKQKDSMCTFCVNEEELIID